MSGNAMKKFIIYWLPPILWASVIFYLSGVPNLNSGLQIFWDVFWRKLAHAAEFGILNLLFWRALYYGENAGIKKALVWSLVFTMLYAVSDELHQYFVPLRQCRWQDVMQDSLGAIAVSAFLSFQRKRESRKE